MGVKFSAFTSGEQEMAIKQNKKTLTSYHLSPIQVLQLSHSASKTNGQQSEGLAQISDTQNLCQKIYENNKVQCRKRRCKNGKYNSMNLEDKENYNLNHQGNKNSSEKALPKTEDARLRAHLSNMQILCKNKKLVSETIDAIECVSNALRKLKEVDILEGQQYKYLYSKNKNSLNNKQKRLNNLETRQKKLKLSLPKIGLTQDRQDRKKSISTFMSRRELHMEKFRNSKHEQNKLM